MGKVKSQRLPIQNTLVLCSPSHNRNNSLDTYSFLSGFTFSALRKRIFILGILIGFSMGKEVEQVSILHFKTVVKSLSKFPEACQTPYRESCHVWGLGSRRVILELPSSRRLQPSLLPTPPWECGICGSWWCGSGLSLPTGVTMRTFLFCTSLKKKISFCWQHLLSITSLGRWQEGSGGAWKAF